MRGLAESTLLNMKVTEHLAQADGKTLFSFEVLPPKKGENIHTLFSNIEPLMEFKPPFIDVTYHREEYVYRHHPNGLLEKKTVRRRPGTVGICAAIKTASMSIPCPTSSAGASTRKKPRTR